uniref:Peptide chain release factor 1 n=2 Tax=unclassified bacterial viruses TaxID=12333 RepID=A0AAU6VZS2_9VIRU
MNPSDLRVTSYLPQSGHGAGGMTVGMTTSGIIVHHIPTGLGVSCDSERSQHANKEKALSILETLILKQAQPTPEADEFARLMVLATEYCPEVIPTPVLVNTPVSANNRTMLNKVNMIKEVREKVGCGLKEAKEAVDEVYGYSIDFDDVILKATLWAAGRVHY